MQSELLSVFEDMDSMAVLIALYHWNPRTLEEVTNDVNGSQEIIRKKLATLVQRGFVSSSSNKYEISGLGNLFVSSLGITKEGLNQMFGGSH